MLFYLSLKNPTKVSKQLKFIISSLCNRWIPLVQLILKWILKELDFYVSSLNYRLCTPNFAHIAHSLWLSLRYHVPRLSYLWYAQTRVLEYSSTKALELYWKLRYKLHFRKAQLEDYTLTQNPITAALQADQPLQNILASLSLAQKLGLSLVRELNLTSHSQESNSATSLSTLQQLRKSIESITQFPAKIQDNFEHNDVDKLQLSLLDSLHTLEAIFERYTKDHQDNAPDSTPNLAADSALNSAPNSDQDSTLASDTATEPVVAKSETETHESVWSSELERGKWLAQHQLLPQIMLLKEACYFWDCVYPDDELMAYYYQHEFAEHFRAPNLQPNSPQTYAYELSIVVTAYNHLDMTKQCIEHIFQYTDLKKLNAELIVVDHGSSDGTAEYLRSLSQVKVVSFKHNVHNHAFAAIPWMCSGRYIILANNDILVTNNWASNLITCMKSNPSIAMACPITPNISNNQSKSEAPSQEKDVYIEWANAHNQSQAQLWSERVRLMPSLSIYDAQAISAIGFTDPLFYTMMFWDDDFSQRLRQHGYRQIFCEDTACYHYGSITMRTQETKPGLNLKDGLFCGRQLFFQKYHKDAWALDFSYDTINVLLLFRLLKDLSNPTCLGVDCGYGDSVLEVRNMMRREARTFQWFNVTNQKEFAVDLQYVSDQFELSSKPSYIAVRNCFKEQKFDLIYLGQEPGCYSLVELHELLLACKERLKPSGKLLIHSENPRFGARLQELLNFQVQSTAVKIIDPQYLNLYLTEIFKNVQVIQRPNEVKDIDRFIRRHYPMGIYNFDDIKKSLLMSQFYFICCL